MTVAGTTILSELQKYGRMPSQMPPMQISSQAWPQ